MSSGAPYPPPIDTTSNPENYHDGSSSSTTSVSTDESNIFIQLQYCSCAEPVASDNSTVIPTTQWVHSAITRDSANNALINVANVFTQQQICVATPPVATDSSTNIPTTLWCKSTIASSLTNIPTLNAPNSFTQQQTCSATPPVSTDSSTKIPTTLWSQSAITSALVNVPTLTASNVFTSNQSCSATPPITSDSSTTLATTQWVKSAIAISSTSIALTSNAVGTTTFSFVVSGLTGNVYTFVLYSTNSMSSKGSTGTGGGSYSSVSGGVLATCMCSKTTLTNTSGTQITYCAGYQQTYSWSQTNTSYIPQINNVQGNTFTSVTGQFGNTSENSGSCPPRAGGYGGSYMNFTLGTPISSQYLQMTLILVG